ncbi:GNAT family N-acetyltransferase [Piscinibacter sp.]|uniref:GNAT family N-acetyltransferase n=1 Tax=Piscinibacter sp. TaxID=1903157 RepID=UPI0039E68556
MADSNPSEIHWRCSAFERLSVAELDAIYRARQQVFVVEQNCPYLDADGVDPSCWHLAAWPAASTASPGEPLAYARLVAPGVKYAEASIGRVITSAAARGTGLGRELVRRAVAEAEALFPGGGLRISAQAHLARFYGGFGFASVGEEYLEDNIPHIEMLRPPGR